VSSETSSSSSTRGGAALLLGAALCGFDAGMIGYVLPAMRADTGASALVASWLLSLYVVGTLVAIPTAGLAVRRWGGAAVFRSCAALAAIGALIALTARAPAILVAARLVQGLGMGPLLPVAAAIVAIEWPPERQGRLMGLLSLAYGVCYLGATVVAPWALGLGWRSMFACSFAAAAVAAIRSAPSTGSNSVTIAPPLYDAMRALRHIAALGALSFGTGIGQAVVVYFPTLAVQRLNVAPAASAPLMLPLVIAGVATTLAITAILDRLGAKIILAAGAAATLAGIALGASAPAERLFFLGATALLGAGITGLCGGPLRHAAAHAVRREEQGPAQAAVALLTNIGVLAGSTMLGAVMSHGSDERAAIEIAMAIAWIVMAATFSAVVALPRHWSAR
jgi:MFS family permease